MKNSKIFMPLMFLCMGTFLLTTTSCSKDEEPMDQQETDTEGFHAGLFSKEVPTLPAPLNSNTDSHAEDLVDEFEETIDFMENEFMDIPPGAEVSHTPVSTGSGRPTSGANATSVEYTVYMYNLFGYYFAAQFSVQNGIDVFEMFIKSGEFGYLKYMEIRQNPEGTNGTMKLWINALSPDIFGPPDLTNPDTTTTWLINADGSIFITEISYNIKIELLYNTDMSGNMKIYEDGQLITEYTWNSSGAGTWTNYEAGMSGSWN